MTKKNIVFSFEVKIFKNVESNQKNNQKQQRQQKQRKRSSNKIPKNNPNETKPKKQPKNPKNNPKKQPKNPTKQPKNPKNNPKPKTTQNAWFSCIFSDLAVSEEVLDSGAKPTVPVVDVAAGGPGFRCSWEVGISFLCCFFWVVFVGFGLFFFVWGGGVIFFGLLFFICFLGCCFDFSVLAFFGGVILGWLFCFFRVFCVVFVVENDMLFQNFSLCQDPLPNNIQKTHQKHQRKPHEPLNQPIKPLIFPKIIVPKPLFVPKIKP